VNLAETPAGALELASVVQVAPVGPRPLMAPALMSFDRFCRFVDSLAAPRELHLNGEEDPLQHPRFFDMVAHATAKGLEVTAATRLPGLSASRAEACVQSGLLRLHVRLDGKPTPLQERSLRRLEEAKRKLGSTTPQVILGGDARQ
jgi:MoaA/NifB/PqqE/SkfB family radical SAM enzyme